MYEERIIRRAKECMDCLAEGIDPISGGDVPEDSVLYQERLSNCFRYVSEVLQAVITRTQILPAPPTPSSTWEPLLVPEVLERFEYSEEPLGPHKLAARLNDLRGQTSAREFPAAALISWMRREKFLTAQPDPDGGEPLYLSSRWGQAVGITSEVRKHKDGSSYAAIQCDRTAQRFIVYSLRWIIDSYQSGWLCRLSMADPEKFHYSTEPVGMTSFLKTLNTTFGWSSPNWIAPHTLINWLLREGFLYEKRLSSGSTNRYVTKKGLSTGLRLGTHSNNGQLMTWPLYPWKAQRYIVSHLRDIVLL